MKKIILFTCILITSILAKCQDYKVQIFTISNMDKINSAITATEINKLDSRLLDMNDAQSNVQEQSQQDSNKNQKRFNSNTDNYNLLPATFDVNSLPGITATNWLKFRFFQKTNNSNNYDTIAPNHFSFDSLIFIDVNAQTILAKYKLNQLMIDTTNRFMEVQIEKKQILNVPDNTQLLIKFIYTNKTTSTHFSTNGYCVYNSAISINAFVRYTEILASGNDVALVNDPNDCNQNYKKGDLLKIVFKQNGGDLNIKDQKFHITISDTALKYPPIIISKSGLSVKDTFIIRITDYVKDNDPKVLHRINGQMLSILVTMDDGSKVVEQFYMRTRKVTDAIGTLAPFWMPYGVFSADVSQLSSQGLKIDPLPLGIALGFKWNPLADWEGYIGLSLALDYTIVPPNGTNQNNTSTNYTSGTIAVLVDIDNYVYFGWGQIVSTGLLPRQVPLLGMSTSLIDLLKLFQTTSKKQ
jgi:hypothetical protein